MPFGDWGRSLVAHYYNQSLRWHDGKIDVVYTAKRRSECEQGACTLDIERGIADDIEPLPFETDTCIGDWHYKRGIKYKTAKAVIDLLVDVVSRNGNLLLNIPLPASGTPDEDELRILSEITEWMGIHSEGIYGTRPWKIFGDGPGIVKTKSGAGMNGTPEHFNEKQRKDLTGADIRFTTKAGALYAFAMGQNSRDIGIGALAASRGLEERRIARVPERFQQIEELYDAARERTAEDRAALLAQTDPEIAARHRVVARTARWRRIPGSTRHPQRPAPCGRLYCHRTGCRCLLGAVPHRRQARRRRYGRGLSGCRYAIRPRRGHQNYA